MESRARGVGEGREAMQGAAGTAARLVVIQAEVAVEVAVKAAEREGAGMVEGWEAEGTVPAAWEKADKAVVRAAAEKAAAEMAKAAAAGKRGEVGRAAAEGKGAEEEGYLGGLPAEAAVLVEAGAMMAARRVAGAKLAASVGEATVEDIDIQR